MSNGERYFFRVMSVRPILVGFLAVLFFVVPGAVAAPQTLFTSQTPVEQSATDGPGIDYELGLRFTSDVAGKVLAVRFWKSSNESGTHVGNLWTVDGQLLASATFIGESPSGWQQQSFSSPVPVSPNTEYVISVNTGNAFYSQTNGGLAGGVVNGHLQSIIGNNGVYGTPAQFPTSAFQDTNYFRDLVFTTEPTFSISGVVNPAADASGASIALSGAGSGSTTVTSTGNYNLAGLASGTYTLTPTKLGFGFSPATQTVTINGTDVTANPFTITPRLSRLSGTLSPANIAAGSAVNLSGTITSTTGLDAAGNYSFADLRNGDYVVTPVKSGLYFNPLNRSVSITGSDVPGVNFTASMAIGGTFTISGSLTPILDASGAIVALSGPTSGSVTLGSSGTYSFSGVPSGSYTVVPSKPGFAFTPPNRVATVSSGNVPGVNFTMQATQAKVFVTNSDTADVSVIDTSTDAVIATIPVGRTPFADAISPDGRFAYVTNFDSSSVTVINTTSLTAVAQVPVGLGPVGVTFTPDGSLAYVANQYSDSVSVIDTSTLTEIAQIPVGSNPIWVAFTPDGRFAYVTDQQSAAVSVINTASRTEVVRIPVGLGPTAVLVTPDGTKAYVTNAFENSVSVINTATNAVSATIDTGIHAQGNAVTPDGRLVYVTEDFGYDVSLIDAASNTVLRNIPVDPCPGCHGPDGVGFTSGGAYAYVANRGTGTVSKIDVANNVVIVTIPVGGGPTGIAIQP